MTAPKTVQVTFVGTKQVPCRDLDDDGGGPRGLRAAINDQLKTFRASLDQRHTQALEAAEHAPGYLKDRREGEAEGFYRALKMFDDLFLKGRR